MSPSPLPPPPTLPPGVLPILAGCLLHAMPLRLRGETEQPVRRPAASSAASSPASPARRTQGRSSASSGRTSCSGRHRRRSSRATAAVAVAAPAALAPALAAVSGRRRRGEGVAGPPTKIGQGGGYQWGRSRRLPSKVGGKYEEPLGEARGICHVGLRVFACLFALFARMVVRM